MDKKNCEYCGREFDYKQGKIFCSQQCGAKFRHEKRKVSVAVHEKRKCPVCGNVFITNKSNQRFCSNKCNNRAYKIRTRKTPVGTVLEGRDEKGSFVKISDEKIQEYVSAYGNFTYISGYTRCDSYVVIRCNECGKEFERSFETIRHKKNSNCSWCAKKQREEREAEKKRIQEELRIEKENIRKLKQTKIVYKKTCDVCGKEFETTNEKIKRCSKECSKKHSNQLATQRKRFRKQNIYTECKDITLSSLYQRDGGVCYLCGKPCDMEDFEMRGDVFVVGSNYPSIEHIIPVSRGGKHSWDNVKIAHMMCNSLKGNRVYPAINFKGA